MAMPFQLEHNTGLRPFDRLLQRSIVAAAGVMNRGAFKFVTGAARKLSSSGAQTIVRLAPDALFSFPLGDNYWSKAVFLRADYEPELRFLLKAVRDVPYAFLDCGANYGYWSVQVTGTEFGAHAALAIEAAQSNLPELEANARLNGRRFAVLHRAVHSKSGETLKLYGKNHFGLTVNPGDSAKRETLQAFKVETVTLDDAARSLKMEGGTPVIVKLDVEGAEADALAGAKGLLKRNVLFLYEDERADQSNEISRHMMQDIGLALFAIWPDRAPTAVVSLADVVEAKRQGLFNFAATPSQSPWLPILQDPSRFDQGTA